MHSNPIPHCRDRRTAGPRAVAALVIALAMGLAEPASADVAHLQSAWAEIMYSGNPATRDTDLERLADTARRESAAAPSDPALLIWCGIIVGTYAGEKGGLGGLKLAKEARRSLEQALQIDAEALNGSAYTSLGSLYYKVPGWPIGFGDEDKARELLKRALEINPDGIDSNFFMGEFLLEQGEKKSARRHLEHALAAPDRPGRRVADEGRRGEIRVLLSRLK